MKEEGVASKILHMHRSGQYVDPFLPNDDRVLRFGAAA